jgi:hypothetical protein
MKNTKIKKVFSSKVANQLCHMGFRIIGTEPNMIKPQYDVFLFEETEELLNAFDYIQR